MFNIKYMFKSRSIILFAIFLLFMVYCSTEKKEWDRTILENTIETYEEFIKNYPESPKINEARSIIKKIYFEDAQYIDTIQEYSDFLKRYPQGQLADKARKQIEALYFKKVKSINSITSYEEFITKNPKSLFADKAQSMIKRLYKERHPSFRNTRTAKIMVIKSFGWAGYGAYPFEKRIKKLCEYAGLEVVEDNASYSDVIFKIDVKGKALGKNYGFSPYSGSIGYIYSGASMLITISIKVPGIVEETKSLRGFVKPPPKIYASDYGTNPSSAPFYKAFKQTNFENHILGMIGKLYGMNTLVLALKDFGDAKQLLINSGNEAVESLIAGLDNRNELICKRAAYILGEIKGDDQVTKALAEKLMDDRAGLRAEVLNILAKLNWEPKTIEEMVSFYLASGRTASLTKLEKVVVKLLISAMKNRDIRIRSRAIYILGEIKDDLAIKPLVSALKDYASDVRLEAAMALDKLHWRPKNKGEELNYLIAGRNWGKMHKFGKSEVIFFIDTLKRHRDYRVRSEAAKILGRIRDKRAVEPLIEALDKMSFYIFDIVSALSNIKDNRAIEPLIKGMKNADSGQKFIINQALKKITGKDCGEEYEAWVRWFNENKKKFIKH